MRLSASLLIAFCAMAFGPLQAAESPSVPSTATQDVAASVGMRIYVDPATGRLSPVPVTDEQRRLAEAPIDESKLAPMVERRLADGTVLVDLNGNFEMASQIVLGADGRRYRVCKVAAHIEDAAHVHPDDPAAIVPSDHY